MNKKYALVFILILLISLVSPANETLQPNGELSDVGLIASDYTDHDADPDEDSSVTVATDNNVNTKYGVDFPTPTGNPTEGADLQEFRVGVIEFDSEQTGTPEARIELWENGVLVRAGSDTPISTYEVLSFTWNANELSTADGSLVQLKVIGTKTGGSPSTRNTINIGQIEWNVDYTEAGGVMTDNMILHWKLDESSGDALDSHNAKDGTLYNTPTVEATGKIGTAYTFDGTEEYVGRATFWDNTDVDVSISAWINSDETTRGDVIGQSQYVKIINGITNDKWTFYIYGLTDNVYLISTSTIPQGTYVHVVGTYDHTTKEAILYVDGTPEDSGTLIGTRKTNAFPFFVGAEIETLGGTIWSPLDGTIDEVSVWERVLSPEEVTTLYNSGDGLAYPFSEEEEDCWTETAGKIIIPPGCKYYTSVKEFIPPT